MFNDQKSSSPGKELWTSLSHKFADDAQFVAVADPARHFRLGLPGQTFAINPAGHGPGHEPNARKQA